MIKRYEKKYYLNDEKIAVQTSVSESLKRAVTIFWSLRIMRVRCDGIIYSMTEMCAFE